MSGSGPLTGSSIPAPLEGDGPLSAYRRERDLLLAVAHRILGMLEPRVELLHRACADAELAVPGVGGMLYVHTISANATRIVEHLSRVIALEPRWARTIQIAIYRFVACQEAVRALEALANQAVPQPELLDTLRQHLYMLQNFHADFVGETVLSQLFPPPRKVAVGGGKPTAAPTPPAPSPVDEQALKRAAELVASLRPAMVIARLVLSGLERRGTIGLKDLFEPTSRAARVIVLGLAGGTVSHEPFLRAAIAAFDDLTATIDAAATTPPPDEWEELAYQLADFRLTCQKTLWLRDLFPDDYRRLFPGGMPQ